MVHRCSYNGRTTPQVISGLLSPRAASGYRHAVGIWFMADGVAVTACKRYVAALLSQPAAAVVPQQYQRQPLPTGGFTGTAFPAGSSVADVGDWTNRFVNVVYNGAQYLYWAHALARGLFS